MFRDVDKKKIRRRWILKNVFWLIVLAGMGGTAYYLFVPFVHQVFLTEEKAQDKSQPLKGISQQTHENLSENIQDWFKPGVISSPYKVVNSIDKVKSQGGWLNTAPLDINYLSHSGYYVLIYFWSSSSVESMQTNKYVEWLWKQFKDNGLVVIGVHSPMFSADSSPAEVLATVKKQGITFPVLLDADKKIWDKFHAYEVPTQFLLSPKAKIVYSYVGEGNYKKETQIIYDRLKGAGWLQDAKIKLPKFSNNNQLTTTQTLYTGYNYKRRLFGNSNQGVRKKVASFLIDTEIAPDRIYLSGQWISMPDYIESASPAEVTVNYLGTQVYAYFENNSKKMANIQVLLDSTNILPAYSGSSIKTHATKTYIQVSDVAKLYEVTDKRTPYGRHELRFLVPKGIRLYSINFPETPINNS